MLTLLNGFFSMSEIALVTVRKTRIAALVKKGSRQARVVQLLQQNPENLFATIQIGISVITIAASTFAGASLTADLSDWLTQFRFLEEYAYSISFIVVVALVSYINITIGELIPKSLGLRYSEPMALIAAYPIYGISKISFWLIKILNLTSNSFLKIFGDSTNFTESRLSEEEIRSLISEGHKAGTIAPEEHRIIENVFDFSDLNVNKIMVPRIDMTAFNIDMAVKDIIDKSIQSGYSRIPIFQGNFNNIVGILYTKKLLAKLAQRNNNFKLEDFLVAPYFVPNTMKIREVLLRLQKKKAHMALITNEHGEIEGLVTMEDILEEIVGDISDETDEIEEQIKQQNDGFIVSGNTSIVDFNSYFNGQFLPENEDYNTVSGFILEQLGRFPVKGDTINYKETTFIVDEASQRMAKSVLVRPNRIP